MAKNSIRDFDGTAANNTDIQSTDISEGCAASGINNAIRELMADIKDVSTGAVALESPQADSLTVTGDLTVDTNTLHVDAANNRVGIGKSSSITDKLHIENTGANCLLSVARTDGAAGRLVMQHTSAVGNLQTTGSVPLTFGTNDSERLRILAGGGLTFNGDTAAANALDDYEEGSYTPQISATDGIGTLTYNVQVGRYTKIGNRVTVHGYLQISTKGTVAGNLRITLPFSAANVNNGYIAVTHWLNGTVSGGAFDGDTNTFAYGSPNSNIVQYFAMNGAGAAQQLVAGHVQNNTDFMWHCTYEV